MNHISEAIDKTITETMAGHVVTEAPHHHQDENTFMQDWPQDVLIPPGPVGNVVEWIGASSGVRQPKFALAAGLTVCGALVGRRVRDITGQRTNLYTLGIGGTSAGKNAPMQAIDKLLLAMNAKDMVLGELTSDSALEAHLAKSPVRMLLLDEIGQYLTNIRGAGQSNGYLRTVIPALTKCWSAAGGTYYGKARARDGNGNFSPVRQIKEPCVCIYGTSAPDPLFGAMTDSDFTDGSIPRFIPFISECRPMFEAKPEIAVPSHLVAELRTVLSILEASRHDVKPNDGQEADMPLAMPIDETTAATAMFAELEKTKASNLLMADNGANELNLYGKIVENARRVALIVAVFRNPSAPHIEDSDAIYGCNTVLHATRDMVATVRARVATNKTEQNKKKLQFLIRQAGAAGITQSELTRKTQRMRPQERKDALLDLIDAEIIKEAGETGSGLKDVHRYFYLG